MTDQKILSETPEGAVNDVIKIVEKLIALMDQEANDLAMNNPVSFVSVQDEKEKLAAQYQQAAEEFLLRLSEFRNVDPKLLERFQMLQDELKVKADKNAKYLKQVQQRQAKYVEGHTKVMKDDE